MKKLLTLGTAAILFAGLGTFALNAAETENETVGNTAIETTEFKDGLKDGMKNGLAQGSKNGLAQGMKNGMKGGLKYGLKKGMKNGKKK